MRHHDVVREVGDAVEVLVRDRRARVRHAHGRTGRVERDNLTRTERVGRLHLYVERAAARLNTQAANRPRLGHVPHLGRRREPGQRHVEAPLLPARRRERDVALRPGRRGPLGHGLHPVEPRERARIAPRRAERDGERALPGLRDGGLCVVDEVEVVRGRERNGRRAQRRDRLPPLRHGNRDAWVGPRRHPRPVVDGRGGGEARRRHLQHLQPGPALRELGAQPVEAGAPTARAFEVGEVALVVVPVLDGRQRFGVGPCGEGRAPQARRRRLVDAEEVVRDVRERTDVVAPVSLAETGPRHPVPPLRRLGEEQERVALRERRDRGEVHGARGGVEGREDLPAVPVDLDRRERHVLHLQRVAEVGRVDAVDAGLRDRDLEPPPVGEHAPVDGHVGVGRAECREARGDHRLRHANHHAPRPDQPVPLSADEADHETPHEPAPVDAHVYYLGNGLLERRERLRRGGREGKLLPVERHDGDGRRDRRCQRDGRVDLGEPRPGDATEQGGVASAADERVGQRHRPVGGYLIRLRPGVLRDEGDPRPHRHRRRVFLLGAKARREGDERADECETQHRGVQASRDWESWVVQGDPARA